VRIAVQGVRGRIGNIECSLGNVSTTGAMVRSRLELPLGHEAPLVLEIQPKPVTTQVRVRRCEPFDIALPGGVWRQQDHVLGVVFLEPSAEWRQAVKRLMKEVSGIEHSAPRVLVLGDNDAIGKLIDRTLAEADYVTRLLVDPRYAVGTAKRVGAKAIVVNLRIDPEFSARAILDALRADPATAELPVIVCARQAWLQPAHRTYLAAKHLRLLLVPFTPEELVMTLDRAISERQ
jgi:CheY-like chemotaxis protein